MALMIDDARRSSRGVRPKCAVTVSTGSVGSVCRLVFGRSRESATFCAASPRGTARRALVY